MLNKMLRLLVSGALLSWLALRADWTQVRAIFAAMRMDLWLAAVGLYGLAQVASGLRWKILARPLGFEGSLARYTGIYFIGMFFNLLLPTSVGGDVVRAWYLDGQSGRRGSALLSVLVDRLSGLVVLVGLAFLAALLTPVPLPFWVSACAWTALTGAAAGWLLLPWMTRFLPAKHQRLSADLLRSVTYVFRPLPLFLSLCVQSANVLLVWLVGLAIDAPVPASYYWIFVPMVTLLTLAPVSISGMGVREGGTVLFLTPFVPQGTALSLSFLWFSVFACASLCGGAVYVFGRFPRLEVQSDGPVGHHSDQGRTGQFKTAA